MSSRRNNNIFRTAERHDHFGRAVFFCHFGLFGGGRPQIFRADFDGAFLQIRRHPRAQRQYFLATVQKALFGTTVFLEDCENSAQTVDKREKAGYNRHKFN